MRVEIHRDGALLNTTTIEVADDDITPEELERSIKNAVEDLRLAHVLARHYHGKPPAEDE